MVKKPAAKPVGTVRRMPPRRQLNLRLDAEAYETIRAMADAEGRTLNGAVAEMARRLRETDEKLTAAFGSIAAYNVARTLIAAAETAALEKGAEGGRWVLDAEAYKLAAVAITQTLHLLKPGKLQAALARFEDARQRVVVREVVDESARASAHFSAHVERATSGRGQR